MHLGLAQKTWGYNMNLTDVINVYRADPTLPVLHNGQPATGATLPYVVLRPLWFGHTGSLAIAGTDVVWDTQFSLYACASSVEASYNLGLAIIRSLQGKYVAGSTIEASMGYSGAPIEGRFETQVTIQQNSGGI